MVPYYIILNYFWLPEMKSEYKVKVVQECVLHPNTIPLSLPVAKGKLS